MSKLPEFRPELGLDDFPRHVASLNMSFEPPSQITDDDGMRYYRSGQYYYPSVTTVLSATQSWQEKQSFQNYRKRNPGGMEKAAHRGTLVHRFVEQFLRTGTLQLPQSREDLEAVKPFLSNQLLSVLKMVERKWWVEGSLHSDHPYLVDTALGYAGCPDLVVHIRGMGANRSHPVLTLVDLKTSENPYQVNEPRKAMIDRIGHQEYRQKVTGFRKLDKTRMQVAAYRRMVEQWLGEKIPYVAVLVALRATYDTEGNRKPGLQWLEFSRADSERDFDRFQEKLDRFYGKVAKGEIIPKQDLDPYCIGQHGGDVPEVVRRQQSADCSCTWDTLPQLGIKVPQMLVSP